MLAFDIETTGLDASKHAITVVALYGTVGNEKVDLVLNFARDGLEPQRTKLLDFMSRAEVLCAFNAVRFDIPFIMRFLCVPAATCSDWVAKLYDPFEESKLLYDKTLSLNALCKRLGMPTKTASGKEAVYMAEQGRWEELERYCRQDTVLTLSAAAFLLAPTSLGMA